MKVTVTRDGAVIGTTTVQVDKETNVASLVTGFGYSAVVPAQKGDVYKAADGREWLVDDKGQATPKPVETSKP